MSYAAAGFMVVLVVHDLRARGPGKRSQSSRVNWQAGWWQTTSELAGQLAGQLVANDLRAHGPTGRPAGGKRPLSSRAHWQAGWWQTTSGKRPLSSRAHWQAGWRQTTSELAGRHKTRYTENHRIPKITGLELAGRLANDLRAREPKSSRAQS